jgi:putative two-component system response regulator
VPVDLILLDMMLPVLSGYDVLNGLKANPITTRIPVIGISALSTPEDVELACSLGASAYITKPFRLAEVLHAIAAYL